MHGSYRNSADSRLAGYEPSEQRLGVRCGECHEQSNQAGAQVKRLPLDVINNSEDSAVKLNRLIPMLPVRSMSASVDFYQMLGFSVEQRNDDWRWAMLCCGDCRIMVDESINVHPKLPKAGVIYLYPEHISDYHKQLRATGLSVPDLGTSSYGMTEFRMDDPDGNQLWIGQINSTTK